MCERHHGAKVWLWNAFRQGKKGDFYCARRGFANDHINGGVIYWNLTPSLMNRPRSLWRDVPVETKALRLIFLSSRFFPLFLWCCYVKIGSNWSSLASSKTITEPLEGVQKRPAKKRLMAINWIIRLRSPQTGPKAGKANKTRLTLLCSSSRVSKNPVHLDRNGQNTGRSGQKCFANECDDPWYGSH